MIGKLGRLVATQVPNAKVQQVSESCTYLTLVQRNAAGNFRTRMATCEGCSCEAASGLGEAVGDSTLSAVQAQSTVAYATP